MPFVYICENCGFRIFPREKYEDEKCRICGAPIKAECTNCGRKLSQSELLKYDNCPNCGESITPKKEEEEALPTNVSLKDGKLNVDIGKGESTSIEDIEEVSMNILGIEIGRIKKPDLAEFASIKDYEETENGVDLHFGIEEEEEFLEKIEKLRESIEESED